MIMYKSKKLDLAKIDGFDWDEGNLEHIKRHEVEYSECEEIFLNKQLIMIADDDEHSNLEERFNVFGISSEERKLALVITIRKNKIRVITARDQNKKEKVALER